ncbi:ABC transporter ATP-binding protein [Mycoplasmopsis verecunda]|uniref:Putative ABC transport system ATP-binding protein n=1 Tax=Mycoplasmopsis verecunda TaxID=171291 RepID=A0A1T4MAJ4_9BACT|nr:ABC transporter ATP-binding protein [Mycoplasmopsis verecunda]WPB54535.1 ABC transporter ATP-binding protein [Mycoplasmopsis verecunda]SJZ63734.1 putative ABC transport system ATP-binding protein [Mycoplasmopsis verecunda]
MPQENNEKEKNNSQTQEHTLETQLEEVVLTKKTADTKITVKNVFEVLDSDGGANKITVDRSIAKKLRKAANKKRVKDDHKDLKNTDDNIIEVRDVSKYYLAGNNVTRVLKNISLNIKKGEFVMIFGKSGGGKSTLLNLISGLDRPSRGDVIVCDENLPYMSDTQLTLFRRKHVSFIFQNYNLLQNLNGYDNVETGAWLQKDKEKQLDINKLFEEFEIEDIKNKFPSQMSGGQQQRISILRALAKNSEIIFADEPTGALDEATTEIVLSYLYDINKKYGTTIVMVTHNPIIEPIADRIFYVKKGRIDKIKSNHSTIHPKDIKWTD